VAKKLKALICDSDPGWANHYIDALESMGYEVIGVAIDAHRAVESALYAKPDVVVTSLYLPFPSDAYRMMHAISEMTGCRARFVIVSFDPQVRVLSKRNWDPKEFAKMVAGE